MPEDVEAQSSPSQEEAKALTDDTNVEIVKAAPKEKEEPIRQKGLTKEELMKYANDPFWVKLRLALFALFWIIWVGMLAASVIIIIYAPKCPSPEPKTWWQKGPIYKVDPSDFADEAASVPFFQNVVEDLDYMVDVGFNTLYLGNIFKKSDGENKVEDFLAVEATLGSLEDWNTLSAQLQQRNIKVIIDFTPDTTFSNTELQNVVKTWADRGVTGFNIQSDQIIENLINNDQDARNLILKLRETLDSIVPADDRILTAFTERNLAELGPLYGNNVQVNHVGPLFHLVTGKSLVESLPELTATNVFDYVQNVQNALPNNSWPGIALSSSTARVADVNIDMVDAMNMLTSMFKATPILRAGDELGFTSAGTQDWSTRNEQAQETLDGQNTHYGVVQHMAELRHTETILFGDVYNNEIDGCSVITRVKKGNPGFVLVINFSAQNSTLDISQIQGMGETVRLKQRSVGSEGTNPLEEVKAFSSKEVIIESKVAKLFTFVPNL